MPEIVQPKANNFPHTYALILCGGKSSRMGADKSLLQYYAKPQRYHIYDMLLPFCEDVFISCNNKQAAGIEAGYNFIQDDDNMGDIGPIHALLTAFTKYPAKNILLIGCDYPFLTSGELQSFSGCCKDEPAAFYNQQDDVYEPVLAWYPYSYLDVLKKMCSAKQFSLQQFLNQNKASKYLPSNTNCIKSIDTSKGFSLAFKQVNKG